MEEAETLLRTLRATAGADGIAYEWVCRQDNLYKELVAVAAERRVDAVVVGASTPAGHRLVGSLEPRLVRVVRWPVPVVP